jgi:hypothetical protein
MLQDTAFALEKFLLQSDLHTQAYGAGHKLNITYFKVSRSPTDALFITL